MPAAGARPAGVVASRRMTLEGRDSVLEAFERHGTSPLSFLVRYDAPWRAFGLGEGVVCYLEARRAAVGWSDPLCAPGDLAELLRGFARAMRAERRGICLIAVSEATARVALESGFSALKIGEEPWFDLVTWRPPHGNRGKKLRWAVNHARRAAVTIEEFRPGGEDEVAAVVERWRASLHRPEPHSFMRTAPLEQVHRKRLFLARRGGSVDALLSCAPLPAADSWYLEDLLRVPEAVNGTTELLVVEGLARLAEDGAAGAAFALAPMRGVSTQLDPRARRLGRLLALSFRSFDRRYGFRAIARYEGRFEPSEWRPRYVAFLPAFPRPAVVRAAVRYLSA
jgi:phosphatidylglycerol lysyltransferase